MKLLKLSELMKYALSQSNVPGHWPFVSALVHWKSFVPRSPRVVRPARSAPRKLVVELSGTETGRPGKANSAAVPVAARFGPVQSAAVGALWRRTVDPASAAPLTL